ncbi:potassium channel family protein [Planctomycetota bacterium]
MKLSRFLRHHVWMCIIILLAAFLLSSVFILYAVEKKAAPDLTYFDAVRMVLVFFMGEYGDTPATPLGQVMSLVLFIFGILAGVTIIGKIASLFVDLKLEKKMPRDLDNHIVMCNWNPRADRIIREIHSPLAAPDTQIVVLTTQDIDEQELQLAQAYDKVHFQKSDPTLHEVLKEAGAHRARSVIILADPECSDPDAHTALIALAITKLEQDVPRKPHMVAEIMSHNKIQHLYDAGVDEWICSADYGLGIIAQSAVYGKLSDVYQQLLTYSRETNEIYLVAEERYPAQLHGQTFPAIADLLTHHRTAENPCILVGIKRDEKIILNPRQEEFDALKSGDSLIVMAFDQPDLTDLKVD